MSKMRDDLSQVVVSADRVRDHLANERTFLAWIRTALALLGFGFVLARMGLFLQDMQADVNGVTPHPQRGWHFLTTGIVFCVLGTIMTAWSAYQFRQNRLQIDRAQYRPNVYSIYTITAILVVGGVLIIGLLMTRSGLTLIR